MTESRHAVDLAYAVMVDPLSDERAARHAAFEHHLDDTDAAVRSKELTVEEKRALLQAGMLARGEDATARALATAAP